MWIVPHREKKKILEKKKDDKCIWDESTRVNVSGPWRGYSLFYCLVLKVNSLGTWMGDWKKSKLNNDAQPFFVLFFFFFQVFFNKKEQPVIFLFFFF